MNILNKIITNNSEVDTIKIKVIKEPLNLINKEITQSKSLLENFFKKLNESINNGTEKINQVN